PKVARVRARSRGGSCRPRRSGCATSSPPSPSRNRARSSRPTPTRAWSPPGPSPRPAKARQCGSRPRGRARVASAVSSRRRSPPAGASASTTACSTIWRRWPRPDMTDTSDSAVEIRLASRPHGEPTLENFDIVDVDVPRPGPGQALVRNTWLSLDPYMRGRMSSAKSYAAPYEVGEVMTGGAIGEVVESNADGLAPGDTVLHQLGW